MSYPIEIGNKVKNYAPTPDTDENVVPKGFLKEENTPGTVVTANVSGTYNIDWSAGSVFILTMLADTTFTFSNQNVRPINIILTGAFVPTFPTMILRNGSDAYDGAVKNLMEVNYLSASNVTYINENLPA